MSRQFNVMIKSPSKERSLRVLLELDSSDLRKGAIRNALDLAQSGDAFGFRCVLCGPLDDDFKRLAGRLGLGILPGRSRMYSRLGLPAYGLSVALWLARLVRLRPDIVHLNYLGWGPSLACAAHLLGIPVVGRAGGEFNPQNPAQKWTQAYIANSEAHGRSLLNSPLKDRVVVTGPLVRFARSSVDSVEPPLPKRRPHRCEMLFLGQIVERKGIAVLVDALPLVSADVDVMIVGGDWEEEPFARHIRDRVKRLGLGDRIWLSNYRTDVQSLLTRCDILVVPSSQDTLPRVVIEAMLSGVTVVATAVGAIPSLIDHGVNGLLVQPGDPRALADAINRLVESPPLRKRLGLAGRARADAQLGPETTLERYGHLYRSLAFKHAHRP